MPDIQVTRETAGDQAERLLKVALELVALVRDESKEQITAFVGGVKPDDWAALIVVLAALVPDDQPVDDLLAWVTWDEFGRPLDVAAKALVRYVDALRGGRLDDATRIAHAERERCRSNNLPAAAWVVESERARDRERSRNRRLPRQRSAVS